MTDWIEHTTDTCPVDPETVVEVRVKHGASIIDWSPPRPARRFRWADPCITHYRIITPAKPPEPEMAKTHDDYTGPTFGVPTKPEPDWIAIRLECLKLAVAQTIQFGLSEKKGHGYLAIEELSDEYLHYVLNGSVDKA
jgi:hypothetical protein